MCLHGLCQLCGAHRLELQSCRSCMTASCWVGMGGIMLGAAVHYAVFHAPPAPVPGGIQHPLCISGDIRNSSKWTMMSSLVC